MLSSRPSHPGSEAAPEVGPVVEIERLRAGYDDKRVLDNIEFSVERGEIVVVLGRVGSGKSCLFRQVLALEAPESGRVKIFGQDVAELGLAELADLRRRLGAAHQAGALISALTVVENVMLPLVELVHLDRKEVQRKADRKLRLLGLDHCTEVLPAYLSRGEIKRAAIARAIATDPEILVCDDLFAGLDRESLAAILDLFRRLNSAGMTLLLFTPWPDIAFDVAHRVIVLNRGRIIAEGSPDEIRASEDPEVAGLLSGALPEWMVEVDAELDAEEKGELPS